VTDDALELEVDGDEESVS
jgi:hypothetical protein